MVWWKCLGAMPIVIFLIGDRRQGDVTTLKSACTHGPWPLPLPAAEDSTRLFLTRTGAPQCCCIRSRSFSRCRRAISAAWSANGSVACVVGRRAGCRRLWPNPTQFHPGRKTESRRSSSLATDPIERPLEATRSTACRLFTFYGVAIRQAIHWLPLNRSKIKPCSKAEQRISANLRNGGRHER
jgi:hypothetical protein